jgi:outer membrane protein W
MSVFTINARNLSTVTRSSMMTAVKKTMQSATFLAAAAVTLLFASSLTAQSSRDVRLSLFVSQADMQGDNEFEDGFTLDLDEGKGYGASANFFVSPHISVEAAVFSIRSDAGLFLDDTAAFNLGTMSLTPVTLGGQFHLLGGSRIDPYVGGGAAYVIGDDLTTEDLDAAGLGRIEVESAFGYYFNAGVAFQITEGFGIIVDGRQVQYEPGSTSSVTGVEQDLELTPRIYSAGLRLRF